MGKKARKTRWRTLDIVDDHNSDSEESNSLNNNNRTSSAHHHNNNNNNNYRTNGYHSKYSYSSQSSTPSSRRLLFQYGGGGGGADSSIASKSTRSSSTTSENKITFNEDEYTRITTPRQDVLFKKGYLNKPKNYQTQTSTGNSTISTGYSTENGTPDHQSTSDLDYESQFVFPNGFVDQNGIYYVNSFEPYPLMLFNPPTYYQEFSNNKAKRYSTESLSEPLSPNNEECTSQDMSQSGGEASSSNCVSDCGGGGGGAAVYNLIYPGYYMNSTSPTTDYSDEHHHQHHHQPVQLLQTTVEPQKKLKKRRERHPSKTLPPSAAASGDSSENNTTDDSNLSDDSSNALHEKITLSSCPPLPLSSAAGTAAAAAATTTLVSSLPSSSSSCSSSSSSSISSSTSPINTNRNINNNNNNNSSNHNNSIETHTPAIMETCSNNNNNNNDKTEEKKNDEEIVVVVVKTSNDNNDDDNKTENNDNNEKLTATVPILSMSILKPEAEEFIPRVFHHQPIPALPPSAHIKMLPASVPTPPPPPPPNFIPIPLVPIGDIGGANFTPPPHHPHAAAAAAFIPPGFPINFIPHHHVQHGQKIYSPISAGHFVNFTTAAAAHMQPTAQFVIEQMKSIEPAATSNDHVIDNAVVVVMEKQQLEQKEVMEFNGTATMPTVTDEMKQVAHNKTLDIATVVSKLEVEAVKQQQGHCNNNNNSSSSGENKVNRINGNDGDGGDAVVHRIMKRNIVKESPKFTNNKSISLKRNFTKGKRMERLNHNGLLAKENGGGGGALSVDGPSQHVVIRKQSHTDDERLANNHIEIIDKQQQCSNNKNHPERLRKMWNTNNAYHKYNGYQQQTLKKHLISNNNNNKMTTNDNRRNINTNDNNNNNNKSRNYSDMLKQTQKTETLQTVSNQARNNNDKSIRCVNEKNQQQSENISKPLNQWISVSSRKKKKNRNMEIDVEMETVVGTILPAIDDIEKDDHQAIEVFESYDVDQLVDVVPSVGATADIKEEEEEETVISELIQPAIQQEEEEIVEMAPSTTDKIAEQPRTENESIKLDENEVVDDDDDNNKIQKKLNRKSNQKPLSKKVIITDIDQSGGQLENKPAAELLINKKISAGKKNEHFKSLASINGVLVATTTTTTTNNCEKINEQTSEKKSKKKKKKIVKNLLNNNSNGDNSDMNNVRESNSSEVAAATANKSTAYDRLLESALLLQSEKKNGEKTNDELRFEFDELIQKSICNSLKENIKLSNIEAPAEDDGFFQSIELAITTTTTTTTTTTKTLDGADKLGSSVVNGLTKQHDFNRIFQSNRQFLKPNMVSVVEPDIIRKDNHNLINNKVVIDVDDKKFNKNSSFNPSDIAYTSEGTVLIEDLDDKQKEIHVIHEQDDNDKNVKDNEIVEADNVVKAKEKEEEQRENEEIGNHHHPLKLTVAVKEWLSKTRENTPEIEIFKSPHAIKEEFNTVKFNGSDNDVDDDDDEFTLFSSTKKDQTQSVDEDQMDFLDYWDNESILIDNKSENNKISENNNNNNSSNSHDNALDNNNKYIKCDDELIEIYESKYGKNEAFLNLQNEFNEQNTREKKHQQQQIPPPLSNLPYRGVCCSIQ